MNRRCDKHFLAPHLDAVMGGPFSWEADEIYWVTKKSKSFLDRAVGKKAWIISLSWLEGGDGGYFLDGSFFVSSIQKRRFPDEWKFEVLGERELRFGDGVHIDETEYPWIGELVEKHNDFHFGFNDLTDDEVIEAFEMIESDFL